MSESIAGASLKRTLGPFSVLLFGLAFLAPLIVFGTYGVITQASGNTTAMAYLIAAIGVVFTALSYGRLVRVFPVAGSAYTYTRKMLSANLGFMVGWAALLDYFFIPMLIWLLGASYLNMAFPEVPQWVWIIGFIVSTSLLNILGIQVANRFNVLLMVAQLAIIVVFIGLCVHYIVAGCCRPSRSSTRTCPSPPAWPALPLPRTRSWASTRCPRSARRPATRAGHCRARSCWSH